MKRQLLNCVIVTLILLATNFAHSQRYLSEVFTSTIETSNVVYGENYSILTGSPLLQNLVMDVYEPSGDSLLERPLIVLLHTGEFLPRYINQLPVGDKTDSSTVEIARRFARMGYVVAVPDYRKGWNPQGTQDERTQTYIQAVYRGLQDAKTCTRWFRMDADQNNNTYKVNTKKIALGGQGSGGFISLAYSSIDNLAELQLTKFFNFTTNAFMIDTSIIGDWNGFGGNAALNISNHVGYSSDVNIVFNIGGAICDTSWIDAGEVPVISIQGVNDTYAPYSYGIMNVPGTTFFITDVNGSSDVIRINNDFGNNDVFKIPPILDVYTTRANQVNTSLDATYGNDGDEGLMSFTGLADGNGPWEFWDDATVTTGATSFGQDPTTILVNGYGPNPVYQALGPVAGKARAMAFTDTIVGYMAPRLYRVLYEQHVGVDELNNDISVSLFPNPSEGEFTVVTGNNAIIQEIELVDLLGKSYMLVTKLNNTSCSMNIDQLPSGVYLVNIITDVGRIIKQLVKQ